ERGAIDAWTIWDPFFAVAETRPGVRVLALAAGIAKQNSFFLCNGDFLRRHPELVASINEQLAKVATWPAEHRDDVAQLLAQGTGIDLGAWQRAVKRTQYRLSPITDEVVEEQQRVADRFHKLGLIPHKVAVRDIVWKWQVRS